MPQGRPPSPGAPAAPPGGGAAMPAPGGGAPADPSMAGAGGAGPRATDQDKETFRAFLANAMQLVYEEETADLLVEQMNGPAPVESLASTIAAVVNHIGQDGVARGVPVNGAMAIAAATTLAGDIGINLAEAAGREPFNQDQIQAIILRSMELLRDMQGSPAAEEGAPQGAGPAGPAATPQGAAPGNGLMPRRTSGTA